MARGSWDETLRYGSLSFAPYALSPENRVTRVLVLMPTKTVSRIVWVVAAFLLGIGGVAANKVMVSRGARSHADTTMLAHYLPSPVSIVEQSLAIAKVQPEDTVYDLGSGDGRVLIAAAQKFRAHAVGIELNYGLVTASRTAIKNLGLEKQIEVRWANIMDQDFSPATVVFLYLPEGANQVLRPRLERDLRPQSRVVSHGAPVPGWEPAAVQSVSDPEAAGTNHTIYLYIR